MSNYTAPAAPSTSPAAPASAPTAPPTSAQGGPYLPQTAQSGGVPTPGLDIPVCAVLLGLFLGGAAANMTIFQINRRHGYKFLFSGLLFGFCMARVVALSMRIAWACHPRDANVAIAAQIFTAAGVLLLFLTNLVFTQRILRAFHPYFGWHRAVTLLFRLVFASVAAVLITVVTATVHSFFTLDPGARAADRTIQLVCATYLAVLATLPIPLVGLAAGVHWGRRTLRDGERPPRVIDRFGEGHFRTKLALLVFTTVLLSAGAIFRAGAVGGPRPRDDPAWYDSKACFYCFNFGVELLVVYTYALSRFDRRFHVPDGSSAPGHYSCAEFGGGAAAALALAVAGAEFEKGGKRSSAYSGSGASASASAGAGAGVGAGAGPPGSAVLGGAMGPGSVYGYRHDHDHGYGHGYGGYGNGYGNGEEDDDAGVVIAEMPAIPAKAAAPMSDRRSIRTTRTARSARSVWRRQ